MNDYRVWKIYKYIKYTRGAGWVKMAATVAEDQAMLRWPPRSPDLTPSDFFIWGYDKESIFLQLVPRDLPETWRQIIAAISEIDGDMLQLVWAGRITGLRSSMSHRTDTQSTYDGRGKKKKNSEIFSFPLWVAYYNPFRHWSVPIVWNMSGNYE
jgi:hypothetical protein